VEPQLSRTGLGPLLPVRVFGDDLAVHKPDPAPLRRALELLGLDASPDEVAYVGDAPTDMRMARAVGVRAIGIASVVGDPHELREAGAGRGRSDGRGVGRRFRRTTRAGEDRPVTDGGEGAAGRPGRLGAAILADGDAPDRAELDAAWPGWDDDLALVVAADGRRPATRPGSGASRSTAGSATAIRCRRGARRADAPRGIPVDLVAAEKTRPTPSSRSGPPSTRVRRTFVILGAFRRAPPRSRPGQRRAARPPGAGGAARPSCSTAGRGSGCCGGPATLALDGDRAISCR
jgi:hypothetical protein